MPGVTRAPAPTSDCFADYGAVENRRSNPNQDLIADGAGVNGGGMADGDVITHNAGKVICEMQDRVVLDVRVVADDNTVNVAPEDRVAPDAGIVPHSYIAQNDGAPGKIDFFAQGGFLEQELVELFPHRQPPR